MSQRVLKCLVIDDEAPARDLVKSYIEKVPNLELTAVCESAIEALPLINTSHFDIAFLDIQMPDLTGVDFLSLVREKLETVIFTTAYKEYAIKGFELGVADYLLKPFSLDRFIKAVARSRDLIDMKEGNGSIEQLVRTESEHAKDHFFVKSGQKLVKIARAEIAFIEGMKEYLAIHTISGKRILTYYRMKNMEDVLQGKKFVRVHRSFIVNTEAVTEIEGYQLKVMGKWIPIGGNYKAALDSFTNLLI